MYDVFAKLLVENADKLPFTAMAGTQVQLSVQRVMEAAIIGLVLAGIGYVAVIPRLEERVEHQVNRLQADVKRIEERAEQIDYKRDADYRELMKEIQKVKARP